MRVLQAERDFHFKLSIGKTTMLVKAATAPSSLEIACIQTARHRLEDAAVTNGPLTGTIDLISLGRSTSTSSSGRLVIGDALGRDMRHDSTRLFAFAVLLLLVFNPPLTPAFSSRNCVVRKRGREQPLPRQR
jgi:hypothetical protein